MRGCCIALALCAACVAPGAQTLYKSTGPDGKIVYSDKPPASGKLDKTLDVRSLPNTAIPPETLKELARLKAEGKAAALPPSAGVVLFSANWCGYCKQAKADLARRGVPYREYDIDTPEGRLAFAQAGGAGGIPLLVKGGEQMRGYSREGYDALFR